MKLFLSSLASASLDLVIPLLPCEPSHLKLAFIATAADPYGDIDIPWMRADYDKLVSMGFSVTNYDLKHKNVDILRKELADFEVIFVAGGNSFYLLYQVRKSGFDTVIKELLASGVVYIGASAGSCIMCPTIEHVMTLDHPEDVPELTSYTGISLVKELIVPHAGRDKYCQRHEQIRADWGSRVLFLRDDQALVVDGDRVDLQGVTL